MIQETDNLDGELLRRMKLQKWQMFLRINKKKKINKLFDEVCIRVLTEKDLSRTKVLKNLNKINKFFTKKWKKIKCLFKKKGEKIGKK